jgi:hypothetical protein
MTASLFHIQGRLPHGRLAQCLLLVLLSLALGCAARRPIGVNYLVPRDCRSEVRLINCDRNSPPNCKHIAATFPKGCEQVAAR